MRAIQIDRIGAMAIGFTEDPVVHDNQLKIAVKAAGVNRADTLQRKGKYPPPPGTSTVLGLEVSGEVVEIGKNVVDFKSGDRVMALLAGGGYAEYAVVDHGSVMPIPGNLDYTDAAAIPEVFLTAYQAMFLLGKLDKRETVLIHAGASGVGTAAIQLAKEVGASVIVTAGTDEKVDFCKTLGADYGINYRSDGNFSELVKQITKDKGADLVIDFIGADYMSGNIEACGMDGHIVMLAFMSGAKARDVDLSQILMKRISITGSTLRSRSNEYKTRLTQNFRSDFLHLFVQGRLRPVIDTVYLWERVVDAHERMEQNLNIGKLVLQID